MMCETFRRSARDYKMSKETGKGKKKKAGKSYSGIDAHKRQRKVLVPPLMAIPRVALQSWMNDRLPEMLWSALLISQLGRSRSLERFRRVAAVLPKPPAEKRMVQPTLSGLATLDDEILGQLLAAICAGNESKRALRPLL